MSILLEGYQKILGWLVEDLKRLQIAEGYTVNNPNDPKSDVVFRFAIEYVAEAESALQTVIDLLEKEEEADGTSI